MRCMVMLVALAALGSGCTKDNPRACGEGDPCTDPALPFCDADGLIAGTPGACIAVTCTPGDFAACDADRAIQCNATGDNYETVVCERGCDPLSNGCRLCDPNETACTNGITATCDASGAVVDQTPCPLGCFESEPRCRDVDPSNGLGQYLDIAATSPALPRGAYVFDTATGTVTLSGSMVIIPNFLVTAPPNGVAIRVYVVSSADFESAVVETYTDNPPALAIVSDGAITLRGRISLTPGNWDDTPLPPGSIYSGPCVGGMGGHERQPGPIDLTWGAGGGGNVTVGGGGGEITNARSGGAPGAVGGTAELVPLRGGCAGGGFLDEFTGQTLYTSTGLGGGAVQLVSRTVIDVQAGASIIANGGDGGGHSLPGGGGSGGGILLEAPIITLGAGATLTANGGGGTAGDGTYGTIGMASTAPAPGGVCVVATNCGDGGPGGSLEAPPGPGESVPYSQINGSRFLTGGGGGAMGRIRVNTKDGTYVKASDAIESPVPSTGTLSTR